MARKGSRTEERLEEMEQVVSVLGAREMERMIQEKETPHEKAARESKLEREKSIIANLEELGGKQFDDDQDILYEGDKLVLPSNMSRRQAIEFLTNKEQEMEREMEFSRTFNYRPWDGAWCMWQYMKRTFGAVGHRGQMRFSFFGPSEEPAQMITINVGVDKTDQVPWGVFTLPFLPGVTFTAGGFDHAEYGPVFRITANGPKKHRYAVEGVFNGIQNELETNSLYRGKAFDGQETPEFIDVWATDRSKVVYSDDVQRQLEANIWAQLRYTQAVEGLGVPLKRAVLLHGPFGTGKTLAAMLTGQEADEAGWTFIQARPGRDNLTAVMRTARLYQPCVVFYEDLDKVASSEHDATLMQLLDDFDGIQVKNTKILCVLTTNRPEKIHKAMARPGRLDAMIEIDELDQAGVEKLVKVTIPGDTLADTIDWSAVFTEAHGYKPAFVTEFATRALRYVLVRTDGVMDGELIETEDLVAAAKGLRPQFDKMEDAKDTPSEESLGQALDRRLESVLDKKLAPALLAENQ